MPALPPPADANAVDTSTSVILFASPDNASQVSYQSGSQFVTELGLDMAQVVFQSIPHSQGYAAAFGQVSSQHSYVQSPLGYIFAGQAGATPGNYFLARAHSRTKGLGRRFRLGGFSMNACNNDGMGFDYVGLYAPYGATVQLSAQPQQYAQLQSQVPGASFWQGGQGPNFVVSLLPGESIMLRTYGAAQGVGSRAVPIDGSQVLADAPVAVSAGGRGWLFASDNVTPLSLDSGVDGMVPMDYMGSRYVVKGYPSSLGQQLRIVADVDNTTVSLNGAAVATLRAGGSYQATTPSGITYIEASHKVAVFQTAGMYGSNNDFALVPPMVLAEVSTINMPIDILPGDIGLVFVVLATDLVTSLMINGHDLNAQPFTSLEAVPGHPEWTAVTFSNLISGYYNISAQGDLVASVMAANSSVNKGVFTYVSRWRREYCGNGVLDNNEECDDKNIDSFDGCSSMCMVEDNYDCEGSPSVCSLSADRAAAPTQSASESTAPAASLSSQDKCMLFGCATGQWCSSLGCVERIINNMRCPSNDACLSGVCAEDGVCGAMAGTPCKLDESCRNNSCSNGHCVSLTAVAEGSGLMTCAQAPGARGPLRAYDGLACAVMAVVGWRLHKRARARATGRDSHGPWLMVAAGLLVCGRPARAALTPSAHESDGGTVVAPGHGFELSPLPAQQTGAPFMVLDSYAPPALRLRPRHSLMLRASFMYVPQPLIIRDSAHPEVYGAVVKRQLTSFVSAGYWWRERVRFNLNLPVLVYGDGERVWASPVPYPPPPRGGGLGDITLSVAGSVVQTSGRTPAARLVLSVDTTLPTGRQASYVSSGKVNVGGSVGVAGRVKQYDYTVSYELQAHGIPLASEFGHNPKQLMMRLGAGRFFHGDRWHVALEVPVSTVVGGATSAWGGRSSWISLLASARYQPTERWAFMMGGGPDVTRAPGSTRWRALLAVDFVPWASSAPDPAVMKEQLVLTARPTLPEPPAVALNKPVSPEPTEVALRSAASPAPPAPDAPTSMALKAVAPAAPGAANLRAALLPVAIQFPLNSADLPARMEQNLGSVLTYVHNHPEQHLQVLGYTDDRGPGPFNLRLSVLRARAVCRKLAALGVPLSKLSAQGLGAVNFVASNSTRPGRELNRRVAFVATTPP